MWDVKRVKAELPEVPVKTRTGLVVQGFVRGGLSHCATILYPVEGVYRTKPVRWDALVKLLNKRIPFRE